MKIGWMKKGFIGILAVLMFSCSSNTDSAVFHSTELSVAEKPAERFGLVWDAFALDSGTVKRGQSLSHLLSPAGLSQAEIGEVALSSQSVYDVRRMKSGQKWWIAFRQDSIQTPSYLIYQRNAIDYAKFALEAPYGVLLEKLPTDTIVERAKGVIEQALYVDLEVAGAPSSLALAMASVYAWTVDFSRLQKGDAFDVLYERTYVSGEPKGIPRVIACHFQHRGKNLSAYRYNQGEGLDYFDEEGQSLRKAFLKAPVEFSRISSRYNLKRFHPVLNRTKAHLGTDYAAPTGTPIVSVGDGVVSKSSFTKGNGKYVKIRHNSTYETQYLHMSRRAVSVGERVRQGQVIGYVGSTGLATGPHVCFRFWKNGKQVDHLREEFPPSTPIKTESMADYERSMIQLREDIEKTQKVR